MLKSKMLVVLVTAVSFFLGGCLATNSSNENKDYDYTVPEFFSSSGGTACAVGAVVGGVLGLIFADKKNKAGTAVAGAAGGCALLMSANYLFDKVRADNAKKEDQLDSLKAEYETYNENLRSVNNKVQQENAILKKKIEDLAARQKKGEDIQAEYQATKQRLDDYNKYLATIKSSNELKVQQYETAYKSYADDKTLTKEEKAKFNQLKNSKIASDSLTNKLAKLEDESVEMNKVFKNLNVASSNV